MPLRPLVLIVPSRAAEVEIPRRLATVTAHALAGVYPFKLIDLARAVAEPELLGRGLAPWDAGHSALLAARLMDGAAGSFLHPDLPRGPVAIALARTLSSLRTANAPPSALEGLAARPGHVASDAARLRALAALYRAYHDQVEGRFADPATVLRLASRRVRATSWLRDAEGWIVDDLELTPVEEPFLQALAAVMPVRTLASERPPALAPSPLRRLAETLGFAQVPMQRTPLAPLAPPPPTPPSLDRLRTRLFEAPDGERCADGGVELITAAGEAAEVRAVVRRLLREAARGVPFEEMGVLLPRADTYAPLFGDLLQRLEIPHRLHPSLPLRHGRCARSLRLLFRCRGLRRSDVIEFLSFAPIPFDVLLGAESAPRPARWDAISREAGIVSGYDRWIIGLRAFAEAERDAAERDTSEQRRRRGLERADDAETLLRLVELLSATLEALAGEAEWADWSERLTETLRQWLGPERDRQAVADVVADLAGLGALAGPSARWAAVETVIEARLEWERLPLEPLATGAVHVGALDALAGLPFRVVAIPGLVEGGYPPVLRPDPFLLDAEREALSSTVTAGDDRQPPAPPRSRGQLSLFDEAPSAEPARSQEPPAAAGAATLRLATSQDRLNEARRAFYRGVSQAQERLLLSYPRADPRSGRERLPSLFFVAAASCLAGRPLGVAELTAEVAEDDRASLPLEDAVDACERDLARVLRGGAEAVMAVAAGSPFFRGAHLAAHERWARALTAHDGRISGLAPEQAARLDPLTAPRPVSASSLATYAKCGFLYLLQHVLRLEAVREPEERLWLDALEQGRLFHEVAELFLRGARDSGALPVRDDEKTRSRLLLLARQRVELMIAGSPPRHRLVWDMRWRAFEDLLLRWLAREAAQADRATPAHFEVGFGGARREATREPHSSEPLRIELAEGRALRVSGKIDRIDVKPDGSLVLRDYKTGRAPRDDGGVFRGGRELQIPIYVLATRMLFPDQPVAEAFLDYVNAPRPVAFDPGSVAGEEFRSLLAEMTGLIAEGAFPQEPSACVFCDYTAVCGPQPLIERRQSIKLKHDPLLQRYLRLRSYR